ncbi:hypothetical protein ACFFKU_02300 [Kineococcus gynurae]|uniref:ABC-2 type transport system permease protein n=1 Tax=Kineococcus gynurae TaxID=452979 RepID=A0ABV5LSL4_9ACTN
MTSARPELVLLRLKLALLRSGLRRSPWQIVALVLSGLSVLSIVASLGFGLVLLRGVGLGVSGPVVVGLGSLAVLGWAVVPLVAFGVDETLDPERFVTFTIPERTLVRGLLLAGVVGLPGLATLLLSLFTVVTWSRSVGAGVVALLAALLLTATCVGLSRLTTTAAAAVLRARRTRDVLVVVGGLLAVGVGPALNLLVPQDGSDVRAWVAAGRQTAEVLGWTPLGLALAAPVDAAAGAWGSALLRLVLAGLVVLLVLRAWRAALTRTLDRPRVSGGSGTARGGRDTYRLPLLSAPAAAVAWRCLTYYRRDPRYLIGVVSILVLPFVLLVIPITQGSDVGPWLLAAGPVVGFLAGWSLHNDVAYDNSAFALHVVSGMRGRDDRIGRVAASGIWEVPLIVVFVLLGAALADRWDLAGPLLGASLALLGAGYGVSSITSALTPYPVAAPGGNPFQSPKGAAVATVLVQLVTSVVVAVVCLPVLVPAVIAVVGPAWAPGWLAVVATVLGVLLAPVFVAVGVRIGGRTLDARLPEVLTVASRS